MYIVDWDQFWLTLAAWWFFVDWDEIWLSVGAWFAFAGFHLTIFEFVGDLDDTPPRVVSVRAAWVIALIPFNFVASLICCFLILFDYRELLQPVYGLAIIAASICQAELLEAPVPAAPSSYPYLASYAVFLLSFASVRLLSSLSTTRRNNEHEK